VCRREKAAERSPEKICAKDKGKAALAADPGGRTPLRRTPLHEGQRFINQRFHSGSLLGKPLHYAFRRGLNSEFLSYRQEFRIRKKFFQPSKMNKQALAFCSFFTFTIIKRPTVPYFKNSGCG
jgi:hypothetical protein